MVPETPQEFNDLASGNCSLDFCGISRKFIEDGQPDTKVCITVAMP
jgi:hypothetical protein